MSGRLRALMALMAALALGCSEAAAPEAPAQAAVLDFSAPAVGGGQVTGADYAGRDLALWFWAPW